MKDEVLIDFCHVICADLHLAQIQLILEKTETEFPLSQVLIGLLKDAVRLEDPSRTLRPRFKALQHFLLANELSKAQVGR